MRDASTSGSGEGTAPAGQRFPPGIAEGFHNAPDALDVVVLADDEGAERLPAILTQHPDAPGIVDSLGQLRVSAELLLDGGIVLIQCQIGDQPMFSFGLIQAGDQQIIAVCPQGDDILPHHAGIAAVITGQPAEALPAFESLLKIEGNSTGEPGGILCHGLSSCRFRRWVFQKGGKSIIGQRNRSTHSLRIVRHKKWYNSRFAAIIP